MTIIEEKTDQEGVPRARHRVLVEAEPDEVQMFEMDINPSVELDEQEFAQFVQDDWGWRRQWTMSNSMYMAEAAG